MGLLAKILNAQVDAAIDSLSTGERTGAQEGWEIFLKNNFPHVASAGMSPRHIRVWNWLQNLKPGIKPPALIECWPRGGGKSTTVELGVAFLSQRMVRPYVLYVCGTQKQADKHITAISERLIEMDVQPKLTQLGQKRGWRHDELQTNMGFAVTGIGLDVAVRGVKMDWHRPGLIILDDLDARDDTPEIRAKKLRSIQESILPAGSGDCAVIFVQNLIYEDGIMAQLIDGRLQFLLNRIISPVEVAVEGLEYELYEHNSGINRYRIKEGKATWVGQSLQICEDQINEWGLLPFLRESQQMVSGADGFFFAVGNFDQQPASIVGEKVKIMRTVLAFDLAATEMAGDYTAYVVMGLGGDGKLYVLEARHVQFASNKVKNLVTATVARLKATWGVNLTVVLKQDPGQAGKSQKDDYILMLAPLEVSVKWRPDTGKKAVKARIWADVIQGKNAVLIEGDWNKPFIEEHRLFREDESHEHDDFVDCAANAAERLLVGRSCITSAPVMPLRREELPIGGAHLPEHGYDQGMVVPRWTKGGEGTRLMPR